jgi:type II secretory pathway pseudopilin PulG
LYVLTVRIACDFRSITYSNPNVYMKAPILPVRNKGFALIVTLSLMILLTVIAVGLLTLSSISLRAAGQGEAMATARANARLALMLAIGDLQKTLGPDRAVTATSEILGTAAAAPTKPNLTGVWKSWDNFNPADTTPPDYITEKTSRFSRWLVSSTDPAGPTTRDFATAAWTGKTVELVGAGSLGTAAPASAKVTAGLVPVSKNGKIQGSYAWHVADESVKARINTYRDPSQNVTLAQKRALLAGHRPDPSVMEGADGTKLDFLPTDTSVEAFKDAKVASGKLLDLKQVELLTPASGKAKQFRNDVTPYSLGVLVDVRRGGLKQDLSSVFEMGAVSSFTLPAEFAVNATASKKLYQSTHGITGVSDPYWSNLSSYYNSFRNMDNPNGSPTYYQAPKESALIAAASVVPKNYYPGPIIAKMEIFFSFATRDSHSVWKQHLLDVNPDLKYMGHLISTPVVTLHNPYNVSVSFDQMTVNFVNVPMAFNFTVNNKRQNIMAVPLNEFFHEESNRVTTKFSLKIANWTDNSPMTPTSAVSGPIVMKPGQTLMCSPFIKETATFRDDQNLFFNINNNLTGTSAAPLKAIPKFNGRCVGFDIDWLTPDSSSPDSGGANYQDLGQSTDGVWGMLGLKSSDVVKIDFEVKKPSRGTADEQKQFDIVQTTMSKGTSKNVGGFRFIYKDDATLKSAMGTSAKGSVQFTALDTYVAETDQLKAHGKARTFAVFSIYARTANGGVYDDRSRTPSALGELKDGRLAGKPFLFHNPATSVTINDLSQPNLKPGAQPYEVNMQKFSGASAIEDYLEVGALSRCPSLLGNKTVTGIKSGSYLELPSGPMQTIADFRRSNALTTPFLPSFVQPVGNSLLHPLMSPAKVVETNNAISPNALLDHSVLANHALYDRFYFSTFATRGTDLPSVVFDRFMSGQAPLDSQSFQPYLPAGDTATTAKADLFSAGRPNALAYQKAAEYQMIRGPFNVNSTSIQAWKAVLSSMKTSEVAILWAKNATLGTKKNTGVPIFGMTLPNAGKIGDSVNADEIDDSKTNSWGGHVELTDQQVTGLATQIVTQVRLRGPFLSMSEFVNRQIGNLSDLSLSGALEKAISDSGINSSFMTGFVTALKKSDFGDANLYNYKTPEATIGNPAAGAPGWVSQGDLLRILEPAATVRSDTFVIRVCGQAQDASGNVTARAYAEAVVQRTPEYVDPVDRPSLNTYDVSTASAANKTFGRRMNVVSFRWMSNNEI